MSSPTVAVVVVAAGSGLRLGEPGPKAFVPIAGRTILERALDEVFAVLPQPEIVVVAPADRVDEANRLMAKRPVTVVAGAETRQRSVACGVRALSAEVEIVLVHDAARAFAPAAQFEQIIASVRATGSGVVPGVPMVNTVKRVDASGLVVEELDRSELREIQTPQGFPRAAFVAAHEAATAEFTDDAALFAAAGHAVSVIDGDPLAFKITTPWDLRRAGQLAGAATRNTRVGIGVDVHAFAAQDSTATEGSGVERVPLWLGGVHWPGEVGLSAHSDGDAICHAMCDALLSAAGLGDLGSRFGTDRSGFAGARGAVFVEETMRLITDAGFRVDNIAVHVVAATPKIGPRRREIEHVLSALVGAPVSVGATTSDGLGFVGRAEGIAVFATCQLSSA